MSKGSQKIFESSNIKPGQKNGSCRFMGEGESAEA